MGCFFCDGLGCSHCRGSAGWGSPLKKPGRKRVKRTEKQKSKAKMQKNSRRKNR